MGARLRLGKDYGRHVGFKSNFAYQYSLHNTPAYTYRPTLLSYILDVQNTFLKYT